MYVEKCVNPVLANNAHLEYLHTLEKIYFEEITNGIKLKLSETLTYLIIFSLWKINKVFGLGWGYTGSERNLPSNPLNYAQTHHFLRS